MFTCVYSSRYLEPNTSIASLRTKEVWLSWKSAGLVLRYDLATRQSNPEVVSSLLRVTISLLDETSFLSLLNCFRVALDVAFNFFLPEKGMLALVKPDMSQSGKRSSAKEDMLTLVKGDKPKQTTKSRLKFQKIR